MKTNDNNLLIIINALQEKIGSRLLKQIFCVVLLIFEVDEKKIMDKLGVSYNTIKKYSNMLNAGTIATLFEDHTHKNRSELENHTEAILAALEATPAKTLREAAVIIEKVTGLKRSLSQIRVFLKKTDIGH